MFNYFLMHYFYYNFYIYLFFIFYFSVFICVSLSVLKPIASFCLRKFFKTIKKLLSLVYLCLSKVVAVVALAMCVFV